MKNYFVKTLNGMALGLFSSLVIGLILQQIGTLFDIPLLSQFGQVAKVMISPAIGAGVAYSLGCPPLVIFSSIITATIGGGSIDITEAGTMIKVGEPVGAYVASLISAELGRRIAGKTKVDIIIIPAVVILVGGLVGIFISPMVSYLMSAIGAFINKATQLRPIPMGIIISAIMGLVLTSPISSAALAIGLGLDGLAAGAALIGCSCHMIGFAVASYRENKVGGLISQGLGTAKIQFPNVVKNPLILIPPTLASIILGPLGTTIFQMKTNSTGAGMGTSGLVGPIQTLSVMGQSGMISIVILLYILPAILSLIISEYMRKKGHIRYGDMKLEN